MMGWGYNTHVKGMEQQDATASYPTLRLTQAAPAGCAETDTAAFIRDRSARQRCALRQCCTVHHAGP